MKVRADYICPDFLLSIPLINASIMKKLFLGLSLFAFSLNLWAHKPALKYNASGKFKIVQFTDLHIRLNDPRSDIAFERINQVLNDEKPDLVILTGDMIYNQPADENFRKLLNVFEQQKQPFAITFGNHDQEQGLPNSELFDIARTFTYHYTENEPGITGVGNCALEIKSAKADRTSNVLYLLDSGRECTLPDAKGYGYIHFDQIDWYRNKSKAFTKDNGGIPLLSLAFFHIPLPEYAAAAADHSCSMYGIRRETPCSSQLNTGMFAFMKEMNDVKGVFTGHDHDNDFAVNYKGILLAYGRFTGGPTEYIHIPNGARVIELTDNENSFRTWIRTAAGVEQETTFPTDYKK